MKEIIITFCLFVSAIQAKTITIEDNDIPELQYINNSINPCDNFYEFSCGNFKTINPRPSDKLLTDAFTILNAQLTNVAREILEMDNAKDDPQSVKKARAAYKACLDPNPLPNPELKLIKKLNGFPLIEPNNKNVQFTWNDIGDLVSEYGVQLLFNINVYPDSFNKDKFYIQIKNESLLNPTLLKPEYEETYDDFIERSFFEFATKPKLKRDLLPFDIFLQNVTFKIRNAMQHIQSNIIQDENVISDNINSMSDFMRTVYFGGIIEDKSVIPELKPTSGNTITIRELQNWTDEIFDNINWLEYLSRALRNSNANITEDSNIAVDNDLATNLYGILNLVKKTDPSVVKNFALMRIFLYMAADSDAQTRQAFDQYYRAINNIVYDRWEYCTRKVIDAEGTASLSFAVTYVYQRYFFNYNKIIKAKEMVDQLLEAFKQTVAETTWADQESKNRASQKIDNILTTIAYPDMVRDPIELDKFYENLRICTWDNYGNSKRIRAFKQAYLYWPLGKTRDRALWDKSPFTVNAYYNRPNNKIIFPISVLNPIFFGGDFSVIDYGRIGHIIGHEITHGFDKQGSLYNEDGIISPLFTSNTTVKFDDGTKCFQEQYSKYYIPEIDNYVNAVATLNENIADNGGVRVALKALRSLKKDYKTKSYSTEQLFFIAFATTWCTDESTAYINMSKDGAHAISRWRVNGVVSNMEEFATSFNCPVGSPMNPENKCKLW